MCQLQSIEEMEQKNSWISEKRQWSVRKLRYYKRALKRAIRGTAGSGEGVRQFVAPDRSQFRPGDLVRVRSRAEVKARLDASGKSSGCTFQPGMYACCGKDYRVLKTVDHFFDEAQKRMLKCRSIVLLEGCYCDGGTTYLGHCDRNCYYFWHASWLERA